MTFEKLLEAITFDNITLQDAVNELTQKDKMRTINYFINKKNINNEPLKDGELTQLIAIVNILQILYTASIGSPINDNDYDTLQEMLIDLGIPRLTGSIETMDSNKLTHKYTNLRGTLSKVYYLTPDEKRTNKSRKYLDEWIKSMENKYEKNTGHKISLNDTNVLLQCKYDGVSCILEAGDKYTWLSRGDTTNNRASNVTHIMNIFNNLYSENKDHGIKFEVMISEENKNTINELYRNREYKNSRQIVTATLNSNDADFKADYLYPIPLRIMSSTDDIEQIHPDQYNKFPSMICKLSDRDTIRNFANKHHIAILNGMSFRTDGVVMTIMDPEIQKVLGRENNINLFEIAYKHTSETAMSKIIDIEFETSMFGFISPVAIFHNVILKGNTISRASLSNKERFDELDLHRGDVINVIYDIVPYITKSPTHINTGRKIEFITRCPACSSELNLNVVQVQCTNKECRSKIIGRILNYCNSLRIQNIGYQTLEDLYSSNLLKNGIRSLYKLRKKTIEMEELPGFGSLKAKKIINEIENKRRLKDYELFGSLGIENLSMKLFQPIFQKIKYTDFIDMVNDKNFNELTSKLVTVDGMGETRSNVLITYLKDTKDRIELMKLIEELSIQETYGATNNSKGKIVFSGVRPEKLMNMLIEKGWTLSDSLTNDTKYLIVEQETETNKTRKAKEKGIKILLVDEAMTMINKL